METVNEKITVARGFCFAVGLQPGSERNLSVQHQRNELSVKDRARIRRDFYFYEKGTMNFVNPDLEIEGRATPTPAFDVRRSDSAAQNGR